MKFREHRGSLDASLATVVNVADRAALITHCQQLLAPYSFHFDASEVHARDYGFDERIGWHTWIVSLDRYGVLGFTDGPL